MPKRRDRMMSRSWLGLRGQFWYFGVAWVMVLVAAAQWLLWEFGRHVPRRWFLSGPDRGWGWVLALLLVFVAMGAAWAVWTGRGDLDAPIDDRRWWAASWLVLGASGLVVLSYAYRVGFLGVLMTCVVPLGRGLLARRAAPGWSPAGAGWVSFTGWRMWIGQLPEFGDPLAYRTPGWYPDPADPASPRRYWDGYAWSEPTAS